jgi:hypothetical protein
MDSLSWSAKRRRSTGSRDASSSRDASLSKSSSVSRVDKEFLVYHRISVQREEVAAGRREREKQLFGNMICIFFNLDGA